MNKRLLIIGNGFDIAHGLPTRYSDFLDFIKYFSLIFETQTIREYKSNLNKWDDGNKSIKDRLCELFNSIKEIDIAKKTFNEIEEEYFIKMNELIKDSVWYNYFNIIYTKNLISGITWVDFESEISEIVQWIDRSCNFDKGTYKDILVCLLKDDSRNIESVQEKEKDFLALIKNKNYKSYEDFIEKLYEDLEKLTDLFNMYLSRFVEKIGIDIKSYIAAINPDLVISYNYTHTFSRYYCDNKDICYIHGECDLNDTNSIVLGINEYLDDDSKDFNTKFSVFKKFVQRIRKRTSVEYKKWYNQMKNSSESNAFNSKEFITDVYVFGHSLDKSDIETLRLFLKPDNTVLHIYSKDSINEGRLIANLIKIVSEDVLIEKSTSSPTKLELHRIDND